MKITITQYLENVKSKIEKGNTEAARTLLSNLSVNLDASDRLGDCKSTGLRLERNSEGYVLNLRRGTPEYAYGNAILESISVLSKRLENKEAQKPVVAYPRTAKALEIKKEDINPQAYWDSFYKKVVERDFKGAKGLLDNLEIVFYDGSKTGMISSYKSGLKLEKRLRGEEEVYVLRVRKKSPESKEAREFLIKYLKYRKMLKRIEAKRSAEPTRLETIVQKKECIKNNARDLIARSRNLTKDLQGLRESICSEEPTQTKQEDYKISEPVQIVPEVTESVPKEYKVEPEEKKDVWTIINSRSRQHFEKQNAKKEKPNIFWNKCKRAVAYGLIGALLLGFTGMSVKHELELRSMNDLPEKLEPIPPYPHQEEIDRLLRGNKLFRIDPEKRWSYKEIQC